MGAKMPDDQSDRPLKAFNYLKSTHKITIWAAVHLIYPIVYACVQIHETLSPHPKFRRPKIQSHAFSDTLNELLFKILLF